MIDFDAMLSENSDVVQFTSGRPVTRDVYEQFDVLVIHKNSDDRGAWGNTRFSDYVGIPPRRVILEWLESNNAPALLQEKISSIPSLERVVVKHKEVPSDDLMQTVVSMLLWGEEPLVAAALSNSTDGSAYLNFRTFQIMFAGGWGKDKSITALELGLRWRSAHQNNPQAKLGELAFATARDRAFVGANDVRFDSRNTHDVIAVKKDSIRAFREVTWDYSALLWFWMFNRGFMEYPHGNTESHFLQQMVSLADRFSIDDAIPYLDGNVWDAKLIARGITHGIDPETIKAFAG